MGIHISRHNLVIAHNLVKNGGKTIPPKTKKQTPNMTDGKALT